MISISVGTAALIIVLSVFNGFESTVISMFSVFDPDIRITSVKGKTFDINEITKAKIKSIPEIISYNEVIEENALLRYGDQQYLAVIKGIDSMYQQHNPLDTMIIDGEMTLQYKDENYAVIGYGVAYFLNIDLRNHDKNISVYIPKRTANTSMNLENAFNNEIIQAIGVFSVQQDFDDKYVLVPLRFARQLLDYQNELSSIEIRLSPKANPHDIQQKLTQICGEKLQVKNRFQQQEMLYKIMKSEKWAVFLILTFILIVASFNAIGSLTMLIIDKQKDITTLRNLGAENKTIRRIFLMEGVMISIIGAIIGILVGFLICYLQQRFGFVKLNSGSSFVINAYPIKIIISDFIYVFFTVFIIGTIAAWLPSSRILKK